jgi:CRP-like cAMP-binding protein
MQAPLPKKPVAPVKGLKTGVGVANRNDRIFKRGTLMFIEGETGREMFILRTGKVKILKQEGDRTVELAVLGPGSVLGELSLLDNQPRGATAQVIEEVSATVVDEQVLEATYAKIPPWLISIIKIVVNRLRETNKRNGDDIVKNNLAGVINIILMLQRKRISVVREHVVIPLEYLKEEIYSVMGVSSGDVEKTLLVLILKEFAVIVKDETGREFLRPLNLSMLQMYMTYLRVKLRNGKMLGEEISDAAAEVGNLLLNAIEKSGRKEADGRTTIGIPQLELQMQREGKGKFISPEGLDELINLNVLESVKVNSAAGGTAAKGAVIFDESKLRRVLLLRSWIPIFKDDVVF